MDKRQILKDIYRRLYIPFPNVLHILLCSLLYYEWGKSWAKNKRIAFILTKVSFHLKGIRIGERRRKITLDAIQNFSAHCCFADIAMWIVISWCPNMLSNILYLKGVQKRKKYWTKKKAKWHLVIMYIYVLNKILRHLF